MSLYPLSNSTPFAADIPIHAAVARYGTPLFIYDSGVLERKWKLLRQTLPQEFEISYSVKANPNPAILRFFLSKGSGLEIASGGEFFLALYAGCSAQRIIFAGPGKTDAELQYVLSNGIGEIHAESVGEINRIGVISSGLGVRARVAVRVNPGKEAQGGAMRMGGKAAPFGIDEEELDAVVDRVVSDPSLEFRGIHLFTGTQILDYGILVRQYRKGIEIATRIAERLKQPMHTLDFGGGLGIPYFPGENELDVDNLRTELVPLVDQARTNPLLSKTQMVVEPGRYLVGDAGLYVARVTDVKMSRGKKYLILDGGMNHHLAASGNLGQVIKRNFPVAILDKPVDARTETVDLVGPLCTPLDVLARGVDLPKAEAGDLVAVFQSGAYARTASPLDFLSHPRPAEVLVCNSQIELIRSRGSYEDLLHNIPSDL